MRHNQASHAGLSLQYRQDLCSIRRCFSPQSPWHNFPFFPLLFSGSQSRLSDSRSVKTPGCRESQCTRKGGEGGTIKKLNSRKTGLQVWRKPRYRFVSQPQRTRAVTRRRLASVLTAPQNFSRSPAPPGRGKSQAGKAKPSVWSASKYDALCKRKRGPGNLLFNGKQQKHQF